ncbi:MAG: response regulator transcription factor [Sulfuritalea sp.]|nr:response regulator transcription factor [Sulfuritalea sp.]
MSAAREEIHILEDDPLVAATVARTLEEYGFATRWFRTAGELLAAAARQAPALVVVDLGLPDRDGMDVVRELRQTADCGVLILTGRDVLSDRVLGLELGADDYVVKPFEPRELVARIRSILRRRSQPVAGKARRLARFEAWRYDPASLVLGAAGGAEEILGAAEARLLLCFLEHPNRVLSREQLAGNSDLSPLDRSIDVRVSRLRKRLNDDTQSPRLIKTVYGAGYVLTAGVQWEIA